MKLYFKVALLLKHFVSMSSFFLQMLKFSEETIGTRLFHIDKSEGGFDALIEFNKETNLVKISVWHLKVYVPLMLNGEPEASGRSRIDVDVCSQGQPAIWGKSSDGWCPYHAAELPI